MSTTFSVITTIDGLSLVLDNVPYNVSRDHENWKSIVEAIKAKQYNTLPDLISKRKTVETFLEVESNSSVQLRGEVVYYNDNRVGGKIVDRILSMKRDGFDVQPLLNFLANLYENPSATAVEELYGFLEASKLPITEDGHFLAYKRVRSDYTSVHDGKTDNSIGTVVAMPRNKVDDNRNRTCSTGLHFCSYSYLSHFGGGRTVLLKINPKDVVSIPSDYNNAKGRAAEYLVLGEVDNEVSRDYLGETKSVVKSVTEVPTADKYDTAEVVEPPLPISSLDAEKHVSGLDTVASMTNIGYDAGYKYGRYKGQPPVPPVDAVPAELAAWAAAFDEGVADGKGHKARKYPKATHKVGGYV